MLTKPLRFDQKMGISNPGTNSRQKIVNLETSMVELPQKNTKIWMDIYKKE